MTTFVKSLTAITVDTAIKVKTDGSGQWRRICHTRSAEAPSEYRDVLGATVSFDGRWAVLTTDWDNTLKAGQPFRYCLLVKIPTEAELVAGDYGGDVTPPAVPSAPSAVSQAWS